MTTLSTPSEPETLNDILPPGKKRGRPKGSRNRTDTDRAKAKGSIREMKKKIGQFLPKEDREYLFGVLEGKESPDLRRDLDIFLAMQLKALLPILSDEISTAELTREGTQRSSTVKELLALRFQMEKHEKGDDTESQYNIFIQNAFDQRGLDPGRVAALIGAGNDAGAAQAVPVVVPGVDDPDEGGTDETGVVSGELPERPVEVQGYRKE